MIKYAEDYLPDGIFLTEEELFPEGTDVARVVIRPMVANEPILTAKVTEPGDDAGITSRLAPGMRAFTIKVDVASGVSGFLRPGDRVDVYWTGQLRGNDGSAGRDITRLIESSVELIAVDQTSNSNRTGANIARTITVQVSPQDVADLAQAQSTGSLSLSLVGNNDDSIATAIEVDQRTLLGIIDEPVIAEAKPAPVAPTCSIRTRRGAEVVEISIPCTN